MHSTGMATASTGFGSFGRQNEMQKAIAIDFDGCLCVNKSPEIGEPILHVIDEAKKQQAAGAGLILWT